MFKITVNKIKCLKCGDIIESKYRHDYATCSCGEVSLDGGLDYCKISCKSHNGFESLCEGVEVDGIEEIEDVAKTARDFDKKIKLIEWCLENLNKEES